MSPSLRFVLLLLCSAFAVSARAQFPIIELTALSRSAAKSGSQFELRTSFGARIEEVTELRFSHPGFSATLNTDDPLPFRTERQPRYGSFQVSIDPSVPPGRYDVRAVGRHGVSSPRVFLVHSLDEDFSTPSTDQKKPSPLNLGVFRFGKSAGAQVHYYTLKLTAGQRVRFDCLAANLDSRMIPVLAIRAHGRTLKTARGSDSLDAHFEFECQADGDYLLSVHDVIYRGGEEFGYALVAQDTDSAVDVLYRRNERTEGQLAVSTLPSAITDLRDTISRAVAVEETSDAKAIVPPCTIAAQFDTRSDQDEYLIDAKKDEQWVIDVHSERVGQPTDCRLIVQQMVPKEGSESTWNQVLAQDDSQAIGDVALRLHSADPVAILKAGADATYRLCLRDLDTGSGLGATQRYFLSLRKPSPDFQLIAYRPMQHKDQNGSKPQGSALFRGGTETLRVFCLRKDGWSGPVSIAIEGLPEGISCAPATIASNQNAVVLTLVASKTAPATIQRLNITGTAIINGQSVRHAASTSTVQWGRGAGRQSIQSRLTAGLVTAVSDKDSSPIAVGLGDGSVVQVKKGEAAKIPIKLVRSEYSKDKCIIRPRDLPPTVKSGDVTINGDKSEGTLELKVPANATPGTYTIWAQAETKVKWKANPQMMVRAKAYRNELQKLHDDPAKAGEKPKVLEAIKLADQRVAAAKPSDQLQDLTIYPALPHVTIEIQ